MKKKPLRVQSKGWKVWVWRARATGRGVGATRAWWVYVLDPIGVDARWLPPIGGLQDAGAVAFRVELTQWISLYGGRLSDIPFKPTLMVLRGTARKVTT